MKIYGLGIITPFPLFSGKPAQDKEGKIGNSSCFVNRTIRIEHPKNDTRIKDILQGNIASINTTFFPKHLNNETKIIFKIVETLLTDPDKVEFSHEEVSSRSDYSSENPNVKVIFEGKEYPFYQMMSKVKWDLIDLPKELLDHCEENRDGVSRLEWHVPSAPHSKAYLYKNLHDIEKRAVMGYSCSGTEFNRFLRGDSSRLNQEELKMWLCRTAILCNGLNKIPTSKSVEESGYVYRCLTDVSTEGQPSLISTYQKQMESHQKVKELGFTGVSYKNPLTDFLGWDSYAYTNDCMKVYLNPQTLAKDISGLSFYPEENECLFLPNTKEHILRSVVYPINGKEKTDRYLFVSKLISKRQGVV